MASLEELKHTRLHKLDLLKKAGMDPYPVQVPRSFCLADAKKNFKEFESSQKEISLAGRIMAIRGQGAILFAVLDDGKDTFQAVIKKDTLNEKLFSLFSAAADIGDIVSFTGTFFTTNRGEQSILVSSWTMAAKSLLPLPEKWHGLQDPDEKFRKRYLDFIMDPESREVFKKKTKFWQITRHFMEDHDFLEVETPTLETTTGGAEANPFKTHHNDYDLDVYLRISVGELWQKRLMAGGFPRTFEIGRVYRNEGSSPEHLQEFTNIEFYASYMSFETALEMTEEFIRKVAQEVFGTSKFSRKVGEHDHSFDLSGKWEHIDYVTTIEKITGINVLKSPEKEMENKLKQLKVDFEGSNRERLIDTLWKYCRKQIVGPAWLTGHPKIVSPLAKSDPKDSEKTLRAQLIMGGAEVANGYAELNDPMEQKERFAAQKKLLEKGDHEAMMTDEEYLEMLEHAMPPVSSFGWGERLFGLLAGKPLRETVMFPLMRPKK